MPIYDVSVEPVANHRSRALGILWIIYGFICLVKVAWIVINAPVFTLMWGALLNRVPNPYPWMTLFHFALIATIALLIVTAVFSFLAAVALMQQGQSGRMMALVASVLGIISGPLGIALGVYTLILLGPHRGRQTHNRFAEAA